MLSLALTDTRLIVQSGSKGGKYREEPVIGNVDLVIRKMNEVEKKMVFAKISRAANVLDE